MQDAKDTFYEVLRDRVAAGNADRTVVIRGVPRPAVVVEENELATAFELPDCFRLRWVSLQVNAEGVAELGCEIQYATAGTDGGLDRGRKLAAMDSELAAALKGAAQNSAKKNFAGLASGAAAVETGSRIWWSDGAFGAMTVDGDRLRRTANVTVWSYGEAA